MPILMYVCDQCGSMLKLASGALHSLPFNRMPTLVLEASKHKCSKKESS